MEGRVKWFNSDKGYGFISSPEARDHYFNVGSLKGKDFPLEGDKVRFESESSDKGLKALNVEIYESPTTINQSNKRDDPRVICLSCDRKMVPRLITHRGQPEKSVCPYCAHTYKTFSRCFIATAVYGDPCCNEVRVLRKFRDEHLLHSKTGTAFVNTYYLCSPPIANWLKNQPNLSRLVRRCLNKLVKHVDRK